LFVISELFVFTTIILAFIVNSFLYK